MFIFTVQLTAKSREDMELIQSAANKEIGLSVRECVSLVFEKAEEVQITEGPALDIARAALLKCSFASMRRADDTAAIAKEAFDSIAKIDWPEKF